jgi:hypothetical protein
MYLFVCYGRRARPRLLAHPPGRRRDPLQLLAGRRPAERPKILSDSGLWAANAGFLWDPNLRQPVANRKPVILMEWNPTQLCQVGRSQFRLLLRWLAQIKSLLRRNCVVTGR